MELTLENIQRVIDYMKVVNVKNKEELPQDLTYIVGLSNDRYECHYLQEMKYTDHDKRRNSYGGSTEWTGWGSWWTMNMCYDDGMNHDYMFIVDNREDGELLAKFLNFVSFANKSEDSINFIEINKAIKAKQEQIEKLQSDIDLLKSIDISKITKDKLESD